MLRQSSVFVLQTLAGFDLDNNDFHEKMEQCDICGSFLVIGDTQSRVDSHLLGKQHMGFARIRAAVGELKVCGHLVEGPWACGWLCSNYHIVIGGLEMGIH